MRQTSPYLFHAHDISYFSGKVRPAFPHKSLWFREVLPDILEIKRRTGLHFFPVVITPDDETWQDTSDILDRLEARHPEPPLFPRTPVQRIVAYLVELYGDEIGLLPAMHYRWSFEESVTKVGVDFSTPTAEPGGGVKFAQRMSSTLPMLGVTPESIPEIEAHTRELLDTLSAHFEAHRYMLGDAMSLADCGLMGPLYGHLFRDAVPERLLYQTAFHVCAWIERMNRPPLDQSGWLEQDAVAPSLLTALRVMADGVPMVIDSVNATQEWASRVAAGDAEAGSAADPLRAAIGLVDTTYRGIPIRAAARPYTLYMVQRCLDAFHELDEPSRKAVEGAIAGTGWEPLLALRPDHRVEKRAHQLYLEH